MTKKEREVEITAMCYSILLDVKKNDTITPQDKAEIERILEQYMRENTATEKASIMSRPRTNKEFKDFLRFVLNRLDDAMSEEDVQRQNEKISVLIEELEKIGGFEP